MPAKPKKKPRKDQPVSLDPIPFEEAVADLLKVKPKPKKDRVARGKERST